MAAKGHLCSVKKMALAENKIFCLSQQAFRAGTARNNCLKYVLAVLEFYKITSLTGD